MITGANWGLESHDVAVRQAGVSYAKTGQDDLLSVVTVAGELPWSDGRSQLTQFIAVRNTVTPTGLPSGADGTLNRVVLVPKRESKADVPGVARCPFGCRVSPFVSGKTHMGGNLAERDRFVEGVEVTEEFLNFQD